MSLKHNKRQFRESLACDVFFLRYIRTALCYKYIVYNSHGYKDEFLLAYGQKGLAYHAEIYLSDDRLGGVFFKETFFETRRKISLLPFRRPVKVEPTRR